MAAGDVETYGPFPFDGTKIDTGLTGNGVVVADKIVTVLKGGEVIFVVIKAA